MNINYDYYRIFYYVGRYKNITQAANVLLSNQPNVTRAIKNLEDSLGCSLFIRSNRGVSLTPEGEKLYEHIQIAFEHIENAEAELSMEKSLHQGSVSIGATEISLNCMLLPVLKQFRNLYPGVKLKVTNHSTPQALKALKNGLVDLAVVTTPFDLPNNMKSTVIKEIQEIAVAGFGFAELKDKEISLKELVNYPLVCLGKDTKTYEMYSNWFLDNGLALSPDIEAATSDQIIPMVKNDLGIGFVPQEFLSEETSDILRINLIDKIPLRSVCLIKRTDRPLTIAAKELEKMIAGC